MPLVAPAREDTDAYGGLVHALMNAPSSVAIVVSDLSVWIESELSLLDGVDRRPAAFAYACDSSTTSCQRHPVIGGTCARTTTTSSMRS